MHQYAEEFALFLWAVIVHWQSYVTGGVVTAGFTIWERAKKKNISWRIYAIVFVFSALFVAFFLAWHDEHENTRAVIEDKAHLTSELGQCFLDRNATAQSNQGLKDLLSRTQVSWNTLQASMATQQQSVNSQQTQLNSQQGSLNSCEVSLGKLNPRVRESIAVIAIPIGTMNSQTHQTLGIFSFSGYKVYVSELVITTNEVESKFHGNLLCDKPFTAMQPPQIPGGSQTTFVATATPHRISDHEYEISEEDSGSEWSPNAPAYMQITTDAETPGSCSFTPR